MSGSSSTDLQSLVNTLSDQLGMPVAINGFELNLLAASAQNDSIDPYRVDSILQRRTPNVVLELLRARGIYRRTAPFIVERDALEGMLPRICFPIVGGDKPIAFLWIVLDEVEDLTSEQFQFAREASVVALHLLSEGMSTEYRSLITSSNTLQTALDADPIPAQYAISGLLNDGVLDLHSASAVTVFEFDAKAAPGDADPLDLAGIVGLLPSGITGRSRLGIVDGRLVLVGAAEANTAAEARVMAAIDALPVETRGALVGTGTSTTRSVKSKLRECYLEAVFASELAGRVPEAPRSTYYEALGILILLRDVEWTGALVEALSPAASALLETGNQALIETARVYLRNAGDSQQTARDLTIHRATLYYRLSQCRLQVGDALDTGSGRASLQLALIVAQLIGRAK